MVTPLPQAEIDIIVEMYRRGDSIKAIASIVRRSRESISLTLKSHGLLKPRKKFVKPDDEIILNAFICHKTIRKTAQALGVYCDIIKEVLKKHNIKYYVKTDPYEISSRNKKQIILLCERGEKNQLEIAKMFGISKHILRQSLKNWGVKIKFTPYHTKKYDHPDIYKEIIQLYQRYRSISIVAKQMDVSYSTVRKILLLSKTEIGKGLPLGKASIIIEDYQTKKLSVSQIAEKHRIDRSTVYSILNKACVFNKKNNSDTMEVLIKNKELVLELFDLGLTSREIAVKLDIPMSFKTVIKFLKLNDRRLQDHRTKETALERITKKILEDNKYKYIHYYKVAGKIYDFYLPDINLIIECNGDYWHGHPHKYPKLSRMQIKSHEKDPLKREAAIQSGHRIIYIWESEVNSSIEKFISLVSGLSNNIPNQTSCYDFLITDIPCSDINLAVDTALNKIYKK